MRAAAERAAQEARQREESKKWVQEAMKLTSLNRASLSNWVDNAFYETGDYKFDYANLPATIINHASNVAVAPVVTPAVTPVASIPVAEPLVPASKLISGTSSSTVPLVTHDSGFDRFDGSELEDDEDAWDDVIRSNSVAGLVASASKTVDQAASAVSSSSPVPEPIITPAAAAATTPSGSLAPAISPVPSSVSPKAALSPSLPSTSDTETLSAPGFGTVKSGQSPKRRTENQPASDTSSDVVVLAADRQQGDIVTSGQVGVVGGARMGSGDIVGKGPSTDAGTAVASTHPASGGVIEVVRSAHEATGSIKSSDLWWVVSRVPPAVMWPSCVCGFWKG